MVGLIINYTWFQKTTQIGDEHMIYRGVKMKDDAEKKKERRDVLKAIGIALGTILVIVGLILLLRGIGVQ